MENEMNKISFTTESGENEEFYVIEETKVNGVNYILVTDSDEDEADCYILKDISADSEEDACYVEVEDDTELDAVFKVFEELLEDTDIVK